MEYNHLEYVRKYFRLYYTTYYDNLDKHMVDVLCLEISKSIKNRYNNLKFVLSGGADGFISSTINRFVNNERSQFRANYLNFRNYVGKYIEGSCFINFSVKTLDTLVEGICSMLMHRCNFNKLNNGMFDDEIMSCYNVVLNGMCDEIRGYVNTYISNNIVPLTDINNEDVAKEIIKLVMNSNDINCFDLLLGRFDKKIYDVAIKNREDNKSKRLAEMPDTISYIKNTAEIYTEDMNLVNQIASRVDMNLRDEGLLPSEIVSGRYNTRIRKMFNDEYLKNRHLYIDKSVEIEGVPSKIELVGRKRNINKIIAELLVASSLLGLISYGGYSIGKGIREDNAMDNLKNFDSYSYSGVGSIYGNDFVFTADNVVKTFDDYCKFDDSCYKYLGFYRAYKSVYGQKLYVMDTMIKEIKDDIYTKPEYSDLMNILRVNGCYLDFIYDRLYDMGYTEIKESKYYDLLEAYMRAMKEHQYSDPVEYLTSSQERLLNKVLEKYEDLSEQHLVEFGVLLGNKNNVEETTSVRRS